MIAYGRRLVDDPDRIGTTTALGLDELPFVKEGRYRTKRWATSIVDVNEGRLFDLVEGRDSGPATLWLEQQGAQWRARIRYASLDMSGPYRRVFNKMLPHATQVVDPFHLVKLAGEKFDEVRRRVQRETTGHRGHKHDPLYRIRRLLDMAHERLGELSDTKLHGLLTAGDPNGEVTIAWHAKEAVRLYVYRDQTLALDWVDQLSIDLCEASNPPEIRQLGHQTGVGRKGGLVTDHVDLRGATAYILHHQGAFRCGTLGLLEARILPHQKAFSAHLAHEPHTTSSSIRGSKSDQGRRSRPQR